MSLLQLEMGCRVCGNQLNAQIPSVTHIYCDQCQKAYLKSSWTDFPIVPFKSQLPETTLLEVGNTGTYNNKPFEIVGYINWQLQVGNCVQYFAEIDGIQLLQLWQFDEEWLVVEKEETTSFQTAEAEIGKLVLFLGQKSGYLTQNNPILGFIPRGEFTPPFAATEGYSLQIVENSPKDGFINLTNEQTGVLYAGKWEKTAAFNLNAKRTIDFSNGSFKEHCKKCGHSIPSFHGKAARYIGCEECGTGHVWSPEGWKMLSDEDISTQSKSFSGIQPSPKIGDTITLKGEEITVTGITKFVQDQIHFWHEIEFLGPDNGIRILSNYRSQYIYFKPHSDIIHYGSSLVNDFENSDHDWQKYNEYTPEFLGAVGSFPYNPLDSKDSYIVEYISPPDMASIIRAKYECTCMLGTYVSHKEIQDAFQINYIPHSYEMHPLELVKGEKNWKRTLKLGVVGFLIYLIWKLFFNIIACDDIQVLDQTFVHLPDSGENIHYTPSFTVTGRPSNLNVNVNTQLTNNWSFLVFALINEETGEVTEFEHENEFYGGSEDGESWSEGSNSTEFYLPNVPAGKYHLEVSTQSGLDMPRPEPYLATPEETADTSKGTAQPSATESNYVNQSNPNTASSNTLQADNVLTPKPVDSVGSNNYHESFSISPENISITVKRDSPTMLNIFWAFVFFGTPPLFWYIRYSIRNSRRWQNSKFNPYA